MAIQIETFVLGPLETNAYVLREGGACWVVDPSFGAEELVDYLADQKLRLERILLTHAHGDHIAGVPQLKRAFPQAVLCCPAGEEHMLTSPQANLSAMMGLPIACPPADQIVQPGEVLTFASSAWKVLDMSGHSPGGAAYYCPELGVVLAGDSLFAGGGVGRTDFPGGSILRLLGNIRANLMTLPPQTRVLSGHGPETTIGEEAQYNAFRAE